MLLVEGLLLAVKRAILHSIGGREWLSHRFQLNELKELREFVIEVMSSMEIWVKNNLQN